MTGFAKLQLSLVALSMLAATTVPGLAQDQAKPVNLIKLDGPEFELKAGRNMSGIHCPNENRCIIVTDEDSTLFSVRLKHGEGAPSYQIEPVRKPVGSELKGARFETDFEAIAGLNGKILAIGSHGNKRRTGEDNSAAHQMYVLSLKDFNASETPNAVWSNLDAVMEATPPFDFFRRDELQCFGNNIEGAAIIGATLYLGFRSPVETYNFAGHILAVPLDSAYNPVPDLQQVHTLHFDKPLTGIRALEPLGDNLLVVTGDSGVGPLVAEDDKTARAACSSSRKAYPNVALNHPSIIWLWPADASSEPKQLVNVSALNGAPKDGKLEGIAVLKSSDTSVDLLMVFDSDRHLYLLENVPLPKKEG